MVQVAELARHDLHGHFTGDFTGGVSTHAISNDEEPSPLRGVCEEGILVPRTHHAHVTAGGNVHLHYGTSPGARSPRGVVIHSFVEVRTRCAGSRMGWVTVARTWNCRIWGLWDWTADEAIGSLDRPRLPPPPGEREAIPRPLDHASSDEKWTWEVSNLPG